MAGENETSYECAWHSCIRFDKLSKAQGKFIATSIMKVSLASHAYVPKHHMQLFSLQSESHRNVAFENLSA